MDASKCVDYTKKTITVTGGANGIRKAPCEMVAAFGANLIVSDFYLEMVYDILKKIKIRLT